MRGDSAEVMQLLLTARFDAVLLDNWMPKINGIELCRLLRSRDQKLPISSAPVQSQRAIKGPRLTPVLKVIWKALCTGRTHHYLTRRREDSTDLDHLSPLSLYLTDSAITPIHFQSTDCQRSCNQGFLP